MEKIAKVEIILIETLKMKTKNLDNRKEIMKMQ